MPYFKNFLPAVPILATVLFLLAACGEHTSAQTLIARAQQYIDKQDYSSATIELKALLQKEPDNHEARWLLGTVYLERGNGAAAEKELKRANELGVQEGSVAPLLARALLLQDKPDDVLNMNPPTGMTQKSKAEFIAAIGLAHMLKNETERALEFTSQAVALAKDSRFVSSARIRVLMSNEAYDEAGSLLDNLIENNPDYGPAWSLAGEFENRKGNLEKSEQAYTQAIEKRQVNFTDRLNRALVRIQREDYDAALTDAVFLNKSFPKLQGGWYVAGLAHFLMKNFVKAEEALQQSFRLGDNHVPTLVILGLTNLNLGKVFQSTELAERAVSLAPTLSGARLLMAIVDLRNGKPNESEDMVRPVLQTLPDFLPAKILLATSLRRQGKEEEAIQILENVALTDPESEYLQTQIGLELLRANRPERAINVLEKTVARTPQSANPNTALIGALLKEQKFEEARLAAERYHQQNPDDTDGLRMLGIAQFGKGELEQAKHSFQELLKAVPGDERGSSLLAQILQSENNSDGARKVLEQAVSSNPKSAGMLTVMAAFEREQGRTKEYKDLLRKAIEMDPTRELSKAMLAKQLMLENDPRGVTSLLPAESSLNNPVLLDTRAQANFQLGQFEQARADLLRLTTAYPQSPKLAYRLARVYASLGDRQNMEKSLKAAKALGPDDFEITHAWARLLAATGNAEEAALQASKLGSDSDQATRETRSFVAQKAGDTAEVLRLAQLSFAQLPSTQTLLDLVKARIASNQSIEAEKLLTGWLEEHPDDDTAAVALGELYSASGRSEEAIAVLRPFADKQPPNVALLNNLAWQIKHSDPARAVALAQKAYDTAPRDHAVLDTYMLALAENGQTDRALALVEQAINEESTKGALFFKLRRIEIHELAGNKAEANKFLATMNESEVPAALIEHFRTLKKRLADSR
ncbi:MAG: PEP-CTERM system TPR-repeat protein PrsT [Chromatiaceae bacterium]|nr:PEP-CTERM system TPR-repeat protein PrsT [Chromatiaceae bacterium]